MNEDASSEAVLLLLVVPVSSERDWNTVPSVGINVAKSISAASDDALDQDMWLLLQMQMVLIWVIEITHAKLCHQHGVRLKEALSLQDGQLSQTFLHHFYKQIIITNEKLIIN